MGVLDVIHKRQQQVQHFMERLIERLARKELEKSRRHYELQYGQPLSDQEEIEIKKGIVLRLGFFVFIPILILFLTLMERGVTG